MMLKIIILAALILLCTAGLSAQVQFDINAFSDSTKYGWQDWLDRREYREELLDRQKLLQLYEVESNPIRSSIMKSMILPGWGQLSSRAYTKGTVLLSSELVVLGAALYFYDRSNHYYNKYMEANQVEAIEEYYNLAMRPRQYSILLVALSGVIWVYNVFDVIQTTDDYNAMIWQEILEKYSSANTNLTPAGIQIRF